MAEPAPSSTGPGTPTGNGAATARTPVGAAARGGDRPDPEFEVRGARPVPGTAAPTLSFEIGVSDSSGIPIHFIVLSALISIEPGMRAYDEETRERLVELFGEPERWGATTGSFRWAQVDAVVGPLRGEGATTLSVPCTYDHEVATAKYFGGVRDGSYPLHFHFNGTVYYELEGRLQILPLAWDRSARFELPVAVWRKMIDAHYPRGAWLPLAEETLQRLGRHKAATGAPTMDACIRGLLERADAEPRSGRGEGEG